MQIELKGGEQLYLSELPNKKWRITRYDIEEKVVGNHFEGGAFLQTTSGYMEEWKDLEFEDGEEAVEFIEKQIKEGHLSFSPNRIS